MGGFRRSAWFGLIGVFVTAGLTAAVALTMGQGQAKPKDAMALIFGIIAVYLVVLFGLQSRDLSKAEAGAARVDAPDARALENPATLAEGELWAALATRPIAADSVRARKELWRPARASLHTAMLVCGLIFLSVPPIYLFDTFVPLLIGAPLIFAVALWKSVALLATGGELDQAYDRSARALAPLGLELTERPTVTIEAKGTTPYRAGPAVHGAVEMRGRRYGREVQVRMPAGGGVRAVSEVCVSVGCPPFEMRARDGRVRAGDDAPSAVKEALRSIPASTRWKNIRGTGGPDGLRLTRKAVTGGDWMLDLWLAERLADALSA